NPGLVEVALLGDERMGDALVLNDDVGGESLAGSDGEMRETERGNLDVVGGGGGGVFLFEAEDVDVEHAVAVGAVAEKVGKFGGLIRELVVRRHETVAAQPAVRGE